MDKILVVDDEKGVRHSFKKILGRLGYDVVTAGDGLEAIEMAGRKHPSLVIMDIMMPKLDGLETLQRLKSIDPDVQVIIMTAHSTSEKAIGAMKHGAFDYLTKPFDNDQMISLVERALASRKTPPVPTGEEVVDDRGGRIIGRTPQMLDIFKKIGQVAETDITLLVRGETGTGKEKIARAIYHHSRRADKPFLPINCAAIPENLLESELFGHERGAFTGAESRKIGKFEQCDRGTMFLDEIGDMPLLLQSKILRVLEDGTFQRLGGKETIRTDVRIIAATNKDIDAQVRNGEFREDLYWRLNVVTIHLPPLRERMEDLEDLVRHFIARFSAQLGKRVTGIDPGLMKAFRSYHWPGNVRELQAVMQRGMVLCQKTILSADDCEWPPEKGLAESSEADAWRHLSDAAHVLLRQGGANVYREAIAAFERHLVKQALELHGNNQVTAARFLGISRNTLREKIYRDKEKDVPEK